MPADEWRDMLTSRAMVDREDYADIWDEAIEWLNEKHCPENYYWGEAPCQDGSFGLWKRQECAECSDEFEDGAESEEHWPMCADCHGKNDEEGNE